MGIRVVIITKLFWFATYTVFHTPVYTYETLYIYIYFYFMCAHVKKN